MRRGLGLVLDQQEKLELPIQEGTGQVEGDESAEGVVKDIRRHTHPGRGIDIEGLLGDEAENLGYTVWLAHVELEVGDGVRLEALGRHDHREFLAGHRQGVEVCPVKHDGAE